MMSLKRKLAVMITRAFIATLVIGFVIATQILVNL